MTVIKKLQDYFHGAIAELRKVTWPSQKQTISYSAVVVALTLGVAAYFGILDYIFNALLGFII